MDHALQVMNPGRSQQMLDASFLSFLAAPGLICGMWDLRSLLQHAGSLVETCELLVAAFMWNLVPLQRTEPELPALGVRNPSHWTTREVPRGLLV